MRVCHNLSAGFDDPNLVSCAGLIPVMTLAERAGLHGLAAAHVRVPGSAGSNPAVKVTALVAGMVAGADTIDAMDLLRHGGMGRVLTAGRAPSTLGTFLRSFTFGHVRQLDAVACRVLVNLAARVPLLVGADQVAFLDIDDTIKATWSAPASSGARAARLTNNLDATASSWRTWPKVNDRRNVPNVEGARPAVSTRPIPPWRSRSMASMVSAPATIPATNAATFTAGFGPADPGTRTWVAARSCSPARSARVMTGIRPAHDTRFGSSKPAEAVWQTRIYRMSFCLVRRSPQETPSSQVKRIFVCHDPLKTPHSPVDRGSTWIHRSTRPTAVPPVTAMLEHPLEAQSSDGSASERRGEEYAASPLLPCFLRRWGRRVVEPPTRHCREVVTDKCLSWAVIVITITRIRRHCKVVHHDDRCGRSIPDCAQLLAQRKVVLPVRIQVNERRPLLVSLKHLAQEFAGVPERHIHPRIGSQPDSAVGVEAATPFDSLYVHSENMG